MQTFQVVLLLKGRNNIERCSTFQVAYAQAFST